MPATPERGGRGSGGTVSKSSMSPAPGNPSARGFTGRHRRFFERSLAPPGRERPPVDGPPGRVGTAHDWGAGRFTSPAASGRPVNMGSSCLPPAGQCSPMSGGDRAKRQPRHTILTVNGQARSEEHTSELQSRLHIGCRVLLRKKEYTGSAEVWIKYNPEPYGSIDTTASS